MICVHIYIHTNIIYFVYIYIHILYIYIYIYIMQLYTWYCKIRGFWCFPKVAWKRMVEASPFLHTLLGNLTPICRELCCELCQIHPDAETQTETSRNTLMCKKNKSKTGGIQNDPTLSQHEPLTHQPSLPGPPHLPFQACRASRK